MKTTTLDVTADTFNESSYRDEFPDFGEIDVQIPEGFKDMSWHNDTCPSFGLEIPGDPDTEPRYIRVFVDYLDKAKSEHPDDPRFLAVADTEQLASDDWQEVTAWLKAQIACLQPEWSESTAHHPAHQ